jgi:hypothetical protein
VGGFAAIGLGAQQDAAPPRVVPDFASESFMLEYEAGAERHRVALNPSAGIAPVVRSHVEVLPDGTFVYTYTVTNVARATRPVQDIVIPATGARPQNSPDSWEPVPHRRGRLGWRSRAEAGGPSERAGLQPGGTEGGFRLTSPTLPGPVRAEFRSGTPRTMPTDLHAARLEGVKDLLEQDFVAVPVISASVNGLLGEPELALDVFLARVSVNYFMYLDRSSHPGRRVILAALQEAIEHAGAGREGQAREAVTRALAVPASGLDEWAEDLDRALRLCLAYSTKVPVAARR